MLLDVPEYPFQQVAADLFDIEGSKYLVYVDRLAGFAELAYFPSFTTSSIIINTLREFFHHWGVAEQILLDGGPNLSSHETTTWINNWGVKIRPSSTYYPQSNGRAEAGVKSLK